MSNELSFHLSALIFVNFFGGFSEQRRRSEEKFKMSTSEKDENQARVSALMKERDEFAKLALERGKALEVRQCCLWLAISARGTSI